MFEFVLHDPSDLGGLDDAALVSGMQECARASAAADARRLAMIAELVRLRCTDEHPDWACDDWDAAAAEIGAALTLGHSRASGQMDLAVTLRDRLPKVGALFLAGDLSTYVVTAIADRTSWVTDDDAWAELDTAIAERAAKWGPLSVYKLDQAVDGLVDEIDPGAVRRTRNNVRSRDFTIGDRNDATGTTSVWGRLATTDAVLLDQRLKAMAHGVCDDDPRTLAQRRADAVGALATGADHLACRCDDPECSAKADDGRASSFVVHVIAEQDSVSAAPYPLMNGEGLAPVEPEPEPERAPAPAELAEPVEPADAPAANPAEPIPPRRKAALIPGVAHGIIPAPLLADLIAHGATVKPVRQPGTDPEPRYRPSTALDEFVRMRDLTCRFPGCDRPAVFADIDHTIPYPHGPTHPGNLNCKCRKHHLVKTFWAGWSDQQLPDGTLVVTAPTGHTYTTKPGSRLLFPGWNTATPTPPGSLAPPDQPGAPRPPRDPKPSDARTWKMPKRKRTRAQARAYRIKAERALNDAHVAERNSIPPR